MEATFFHAYTVGICHASACTNLDPEHARVRLNSEHPTGLDHGWELDSAGEFRDGTPMPAPCPDAPDRKHYPFSC